MAYRRHHCQNWPNHEDFWHCEAFSQILRCPNLVQRGKGLDGGHRPKARGFIDNLLDVISSMSSL